MPASSPTPIITPRPKIDPLVGRTRELDAVLAAMGADHDHSVFFVDGALGIGKSALVRRAVGMLDQHVDERMPRPDVCWISADRPHPEALTAMTDPGLRTRGRTVLVVDDVQWLDGELLEQLERLMIAPTPSRLNIVLLHRPTGVPLRLLTAARRSGARLDRLALGPLARENIESLIDGVPEEGRRVISSHADGNPLFATLLVQVWRSAPEPQAFRAALKGVRLGELPSAHGALRADIERLPPAARAVLGAIALSGTFRVATVARLVERDEGEIRSAVETLTAIGMLSMHAGEVTIVHPILRAAVYRSIPLADRRRAHRIVLEDALEPHPHARAEHLSMIGDELSADEIVELCRAAHERIIDDPHDAVRWTASTLHIAHDQRDVIRARAFAAIGDRDSALRALGPDRADAPPALHAERVRIGGELASPAGEGYDSLPARLECADALLARDDWSGAARVLRSGGEAGDALAAQALLALERTEFATSSIANAEFTRAMDAFESSPDLDLLPALVWASAAGVQLERWRDSAVLANRGIRAARAHGDARRHAILQGLMAYILAIQGAGHSAYVMAVAAHAAATTARDSDALRLTAVARILASDVDRGDFASERSHVIDAPAPATGWIARLSAPTALSLGARRGQPVVDAPGPAWQGVGLALRYAATAEGRAAREDAAGAARLLDAAYLSHTRSGGSIGAGWLALSAARAHLYLGDVDRAAALARDAQLRFDAAEMPGARVIAERVELVIADHASARVLTVLTIREREVAELVALGRANKEIAAALGISVRTVEEHVARIRGKLGVPSRAAIGGALASATGLIPGKPRVQPTARPA